MKEYTNIKCDVLVVGGGIGGLCCAVSIKEWNPGADVLVVEKNFAGYSGKANRGGGVLQYFDPKKIDPWEFVKFHAEKIGAYLGDQELMAKYVSMNEYMLDKLSSWGASLPRREDGNYMVMPTGPMTAMIVTDLDISLQVRRTAEKLGVRFIDKTALIDLLTDENGITGAAVFSILDGACSVINAKRVVLATGSQNYRMGSMWSSGRGDGIAAAYRAGAELRNVEFGNFAQLARIRSHNEVVFGENFMYNAKDEHITKNFLTERETDITSTAIREWYRQVRDGNGPVRIDYGQPKMPPAPPKEDKPKAPPKPQPKRYGDTFRMLNHTSAETVDRDMEVAPLFIGEQSPIKVNHNMKTTIPGLYAIGDCSYCGSGVAGAVPAPPGRNRGSGILNAVFAAIQCGDEIGHDDLSGVLRAFDEAQAQKAFARTEAPLNRKGVSPKEIIALVQKAMVPVEQSVWMREDRMRKAMGYVEQAKGMLPLMTAADTHGVLECLEAEAMVLSAEMHYRASEMRKESRGWFLREDYPETDNENWHKWIVVKNVNGKMTFSTEEIPEEKWPAPKKV